MPCRRYASSAFPVTVTGNVPVGAAVGRVGWYGVVAPTSPKIGLRAVGDHLDVEEVLAGRGFEFGKLGNGLPPSASTSTSRV